MYVLMNTTKHPTRMSDRDNLDVSEEELKKLERLARAATAKQTLADYTDEGRYGTLGRSLVWLYVFNLFLVFAASATLLGLILGNVVSVQQLTTAGAGGATKTILCIVLGIICVVAFFMMMLLIRYRNSDMFKFIMAQHAKSVLRWSGFGFWT